MDKRLQQHYERYIYELTEEIRLLKKYGPVQTSWSEWVGVLVMLLAFYVLTAFTAYAIKYPKLTSTQVLLNFWEAMTWR